MTERGYLVIADLSGYTRFLTGSELEHAQGILEDLFAVILDRLHGPLLLSNMQGDAFLSYAADETLLSSGQIMDALEAIYFGFRERLTSIVDNTSCPCRACTNAGNLDLKFIVHHGDYAIQDIAGRRELAGSDVILLHRLLKNNVAESTGTVSYALITKAAADALSLAELDKHGTEYVADIEEFGKVECIVVDFGARWREYHKAHEIVVKDDELWFEPVSALIPARVETVWEAQCNPLIMEKWNTVTRQHVRTVGDPARLNVGAVDHCAHGNELLVMRYIDVRPLRHFTQEMAIPLNGKARWTWLFAPENEATRVTVKVARPIGPNPLATMLLLAMSRIRERKKVEKMFHTQLDLLKEYLAGSRRGST